MYINFTHNLVDSCTFFLLSESSTGDTHTGSHTRQDCLNPLTTVSVTATVSQASAHSLSYYPTGPLIQNNPQSVHKGQLADTDTSTSCVTSAKDTQCFIPSDKRVISPSGISSPRLNPKSKSADEVSFGAGATEFFGQCCSHSVHLHSRRVAPLTRRRYNCRPIPTSCFQLETSVPSSASVVYRGPSHCASTSDMMTSCI